jgi:hypothetical protein
MGKSTISMAIFNSYVSLPEGNWLVVWNICYFAIGNFIIPTDEVIFFRGVG